MWCNVVPVISSSLKCYQLPPIPILDGTILKLIPLVGKPNDAKADWSWILLQTKMRKKIAASVDAISEIASKWHIIWSDYAPDYLNASSAYAFLTVKEPKTTVAVKSEDLENFIDAICFWFIDADNPLNCLNIHFDSQESINIKAGNQEENIRNIDLMDFYHTKLIDLNREETDVLKARLKFSSIFARFV
uniref:Uncharacterized protein n=1 Tax=Tetranychus urticae TaxID=32264 RepID=T1L660_TETUR